MGEGRIGVSVHRLSSALLYTHVEHRPQLSSAFSAADFTLRSCPIHLPAVATVTSSTPYSFLASQFYQPLGPHCAPHLPTLVLALAFLACPHPYPNHSGVFTCSQDCLLPHPGCYLLPCLVSIPHPPLHLPQSHAHAHPRPRRHPILHPTLALPSHLPSLPPRPNPKPTPTQSYR